MSISDQLDKLMTHLTNAYAKCEEKGATMPAYKNMQNLAACIESITSGGSGGGSGSEVYINETNISDYFTISSTDEYYFELSGNKFTSNNAGAGYSTALTYLLAKKDMKISFEYSYSTEENYDKFTLEVNGEIIENEVSGATTVKTYSGTLPANEAIMLQYAKDSSVNDNNDECSLYNLVVQEI